MKHLLVSLFALTIISAAAEPEVIPIQVRENLRIVYQVTDDAQHEGVNKGLFYARKLSTPTRSTGSRRSRCIFILSITARALRRW
jgi:hypothetical protein